MRHIERSGLFKRQLILFAQDYKNRAGLETAENFLDAVQNAIDFIANKPLACAVYQEASQHDALKGFEFRKWSRSWEKCIYQFGAALAKSLRLWA